MTIFICDEDNCPNAGIIYDFGDESPVRAECGGCKAVIEPVKEN